MKQCLSLQPEEAELFISVTALLVVYDKTHRCCHSRATFSLSRPPSLSLPLAMILYLLTGAICSWTLCFVICAAEQTSCRPYKYSFPESQAVTHWAYENKILLPLLNKYASKQTKAVNLFQPEELGQLKKNTKK